MLAELAILPSLEAAVATRLPLALRYLTSFLNILPFTLGDLAEGGYFSPLTTAVSPRYRPVPSGLLLHLVSW